MVTISKSTGGTQYTLPNSLILSWVYTILVKLPAGCNKKIHKYPFIWKVTESSQ